MSAQTHCTLIFITGKNLLHSTERDNVSYTFYRTQTRSNCLCFIFLKIIINNKNTNTMTNFTKLINPLKRTGHLFSCGFYKDEFRLSDNSSPQIQFSRQRHSLHFPVLTLAATLVWAAPSRADFADDANNRLSQLLTAQSPYLRPFQEAFAKPFNNNNIIENYPNPTMNYPYYWAWKKFIEINRPAQIHPYIARWETWASDDDTFPVCPDAGNPPVWPDYTSQIKRLGPRKPVISIETTAPPFDWYVLENGIPTVLTTVSDTEEVRRNQASFYYIAESGFYYTEGLRAAYQVALSAVDEAGGSASQSMAAVLRLIEFPIDSIEMKADWVPIEYVPEAERDDYYRTIAITVDEDGNESGPAEYGLVAMHISTKEVPTWFWATWMNKNVLGRCDYIGCRDDFGIIPPYTKPHADANYPYEGGELTDELQAMMLSAGLDKAFQNYRLVGTQTSFVDPTGQPTLLSNTITEQYQLQTTSCITCHARAAVDSTGATISVISDTALSETPLPGDTLVTDNGVPDTSWFWTFENGTDQDGNTVDYFSSSTEITGVTAVQLDFVWGMAFAKSVNNCSSD